MINIINQKQLERGFPHPPLSTSSSCVKKTTFLFILSGGLRVSWLTVGNKLKCLSFNLWSFTQTNQTFFRLSFFFNLELLRQCPKNPGEPSILHVHTDSVQHQAAVPWPDWRTPCGCGCGSAPGGTRATWQWLRPRGGGPVRAAKALDRPQALSRSGTHLHSKVSAAKVT